MENKARKKRKTETELLDINKKNRHITINEDIYKEISGIKYDIYLVKEILKNNKKSQNEKNSKNSKILYLERIIKENVIKRDKEMNEIKSEIQEIKEMILNIHFQKVNISQGNIREVIKDNDMSYIN
jgi:uncharacterized protein (UPF0335 family)|tara:strand:- start:3031 stop:3411 length:381 start_codon:yes stop_codon:yes gene_type:complete